MKSEINLLDYFRSVGNFKLERSKEVDPTEKDFLLFLRKTFTIVDLTAPTRLLYNANKYASLEFADFVDNLIGDFGTQRFQKCPRRHDKNVSAYESINFQYSQLKGPMWQKLCARVGREAFTQLIGGSQYLILKDERFPNAVIFKNDYAEVSKRVTPEHVVTNTNIYYRSRPRRIDVRLFHSEDSSCITSVLGVSHCKSKNLAKKLRGLRDLLTRAKTIDASLNYSEILRTCCQPQAPLSNSIFERATPILFVYKYVIVVLFTVFPPSTFGGTKGKAVISSAVRKFLKVRTSEVNVLITMNRLKTSKIAWIGRSSVSTSRQDFAMRKSILLKFLKWMFSELIPTIVKSYWYVTDHCLKSLFFLHEVWNDLARNWLRTYTANYLFETKTIRSEPTEQIFSHGILRLSPKSNEFRPLCIPIKDNTLSDQIIPNSKFSCRSYAEYDRNFIRPIREIIRFQQKQRWPLHVEQYPECTSVRDVGRHLCNFKKMLMNYHEQLPRLYGVKFDMKHSFDNLNQAKVIQCIESLFDGISDDEEFFVRQYETQSNPSAKFSSRKSLVKLRKDVTDFDLFNSVSCRSTHDKYLIIADKQWTARFSKASIMEFVKGQILTSTVEIPGSAYKKFRRKRGIFQGLPLLATFCDIVYNVLAEELIFGSKVADLKSTLLRLADDFLFISTSEHECNTFYDLARSSIAAKYGTYMNEQKCQIISATPTDATTMSFVGLTLDLGSMQLRRNTALFPELAKRSEDSFERNLSYLLWHLRLKISDSFLYNRRTQGIQVIADNVKDVLTPILRSVLRVLPTIEGDARQWNSQLEVFLFQMMQVVILKLSSDEYSFETEDRKFLADGLWHTIHSTMSRRDFLVPLLWNLKQRID